MKELIKVIKKLQKEHPVVYMGDGFFQNMRFHTNPGITNEKCEQLKAENNLILPKDYEEFIKFSNGLQFWDDDPEGFSSLEEAIGIAEARERLSSGKIAIAYFLSDSIYMDTTTPEGSLYFSLEDISELEPLNMGFKHFLELMLIFGGSPFWTGEVGIYPNSIKNG